MAEHPLDWLRERHEPAARPGGYIWLPGVSAVEDGGPRFGSDLQIRVATGDEIEELRYLLSYFQARFGPRNPWETVAHETKQDDGTSIAYEPLHEGAFRYVLLEHTSPSNIRAHTLMSASVMSRAPALEAGYSLHRSATFESGGSIPFGVGSSRVVDRLLRGSDDSQFLPLSSTDAADLAAVYERFVQADPDERKTLERAIGEFMVLLEVPRAELRLLGYFSILESLLVHQPNPSDPYDSITRQVKKKMALLQKRFERPLDIGALGQASLDPEKMWAKMYELRSVVAHGGRPIFESGRLQGLGGMSVAESLVREAVRSILRQRLHEPVLLSDLKEC